MLFFALRLRDLLNELSKRAGHEHFDRHEERAIGRRKKISPIADPVRSAVAMLQNPPIGARTYANEIQITQSRR